ncbi:MAG: spermidine/putrescine ABC transporter substrate-binding protein, partial [Anaerolineales bacterium]|nr:spermidine/putrescine ABC transporter substrate-binding protein [Anaerolineales bacterium]
KYRFWLMTMLLIVALAAVACGGSTEEPAAPAEEEVAAEPAAEEETAEEPAEEEMDDESAAEEMAGSDRCGDTSQLSDTLNFYNWADYMDEEILAQFEEECGVTVVQDIYSSNEDLIAKIQAGNSGYDLIVPSDYAVEILIDRGLLKELDFDNIPNFSNIDPALTGLYYDPDNQYSIPYQWGTTGLAYNTAYFDTPPDSWAYMFDPELVCENSGFVSMLDDERESVGAALSYLGYSYNDTDPEHHAEAQELLAAQKECLAGYNSDNFNQTLAAEEVVLAHAWSGGTALARDENENVAFVIPKEGGAIWMDNMAIPADAPNAYTAEVFVNYLLDAEIGAQLSNYIYYFSPNLASQPLLDEYYFDLLTSGGMIVDDEVQQRLEWIERSEETIIFSDTWTAVKAR